jgi:hypothetical protein
VRGPGRNHIDRDFRRQGQAKLDLSGSPLPVTVLLIRQQSQKESLKVMVPSEDNRYG